MNRLFFSFVVVVFLFCSSLAFAQYEDEPYLEGYVGGNYSLPTGTLKNDMIPDSLNAKGGFGGEIGIGYYWQSNVIIGLYFSGRNMAAEDLDLNHRMYDLGLYGKYLFKDITESSLSPYLKINVGMNFSKLATKVESEGGGVAFRELSFDPALQGGVALGIHKKTNSRGGIYLEVGYQMDMMDGVKGEFRGTDYEFADNNGFIMFKLGVLFNIGRKE
ncbi:MAG: outer membrane beta-barrel protein [Candidatus Zixiibacteriota bacterium]